VCNFAYDYRVSTRGSRAAEWDKNTWGPLEDLAQNHPEAGVHFQGMFTSFRFTQISERRVDCEIHSRSKDVGSATANWFAELLSPNPWFKDVVPNVSGLVT
jgi:D-amino-acid oxidase